MFGVTNSNTMEMICQWLCLPGRLKTARPPSARPAAPRLKEKTEILAEEAMQARWVRILVKLLHNDITMKTLAFSFNNFFAKNAICAFSSLFNHAFHDLMHPKVSKKQKPSNAKIKPL